MKRCSKCGKSKKIDDFYRMAENKDGRRPECIACHNKQKEQYKRENPVLHRCNVIGQSIIKRTVTDVNRPANKCYRDNDVVSKIGDTGKEISNYLYKNYYVEIENLIDSGKIPTVNRKDPTGDYEPSNIEIISFKENTIDGVRNAVKVTSKPVIAVDREGVEKHFKSVSEASRELGIKRDTVIRNRDRGTRSRAGYIFYEP